MTCAPRPARPLRDRAAARAVTRHHDRLAGQQHVRGPQQPVDDRLAGAVAVVEHPPGHRGVGGHDREGQRAGRRHPAQPGDPGRRGLAAAGHSRQQLGALGVQRVHQVAAVVHDQVGRAVQGAVQMGVVRLPVDARSRADEHPGLTRQRRRDVVLSRQRVRRGEVDPPPAGRDQPDQDGRLRRDVQAGRDRAPGERPLAGVLLPQQPEHRHRPLRPRDPRQPAPRPAPDRRYRTRTRRPRRPSRSPTDSSDRRPYEPLVVP